MVSNEIDMMAEKNSKVKIRNSAAKEVWSFQDPKKYSTKYNWVISEIEE
jgi:hypothetical protein